MTPFENNGKRKFLKSVQSAIAVLVTASSLSSLTLPSSSSVQHIQQISSSQEVSLLKTKSIEPPQLIIQPSSQKNIHLAGHRSHSSHSSHSSHRSHYSSSY